MAKKLGYIPIVIFLLLGCEKESSQVQVKYLVNDGYSKTEITYLDENNNLNTKNIDFQSSEDDWEYSFSRKKGNIVFLSSVYHDTISSINIKILLDGKIYKQGFSNNEPDKYLTVSGTIPY